MDDQHQIDSPDTVAEPHKFARGAFLISRSIFQSGVWLRDHIYLKAWVCMIGKANHQDVEKDGFIYRRGELVTTYGEIIEALSVEKRRKRVGPTLKRVRHLLDWFIGQGMIEKTPLKENETPPIFHPSSTQDDHLKAGRGAYIGLKIKIANYDLYQNLDNYKGRRKGTHTGRRGADQGHNNKNEVRMKKKGNRKMKKQYIPNSIEFGLSTLLLKKIRERKPDFKKPNLQKWAENIDLMIRDDKRSPARIREAILWCQENGFWKNIIVNTGILRRQFDQLEMKMVDDIDYPYIQAQASGDGGLE